MPSSFDSPCQPSGTQLNWYPTFAEGTYTGQNQAAWSVSGNSKYISYGGEFPTVNGVKAKGGSLNATGPTVAGGMLFVNSGYGALGGMPGNVLLAFGLE